MHKLAVDHIEATPSISVVKQVCRVVFPGAVSLGCSRTDKEEPLAERIDARSNIIAGATVERRPVECGSGEILGTRDKDVRSAVVGLSVQSKLAGGVTGDEEPVVVLVYGDGCSLAVPSSSLSVPWLKAKTLLPFTSNLAAHASLPPKLGVALSTEPVVLPAQ